MKENKKIIFEHDFPYLEGWASKFVNELNCTIVDNRQIILPEKVGIGSCFYTQISSEITTFVIDQKLNANIEISRRNLNEDTYLVLCYDLSPDTNKLIIDGNENLIGSKPNVRFTIIDSLNKATYVAKSGSEIYLLRIFIKKCYIENYLKENNITTNFNRLIDEIDNFQGRIDSKSKVRLYDLKRKSFNDPNYELYLKGTASKLLWKFLNRIKNYNQPDWIFTEDHRAVIESEKNLISNLTEPFPGVEHLANKVNMSETKYKELFKKIFEDTPLHHFLNEKLSFAHELLLHNKVKTIAELAEYLGYSSVSHFSAIYKKKFGVSPHESHIADE